MTNFPGPDEVQIESVRLARQWSRLYCRAGPGGKPDCGWYHGFWQIARALGVGRVTGGHADFLLQVLRAHAGDGSFRRVLVSGTADHTMPALAYRAYEAQGADLDLTVLDWCETPLALSRWHAERVGRSMRTVCTDVLDFRSSGAFDLVLTNSFLGYFRPEQRPTLFHRWAELLRPGGKVLLTNRVRAEFGTGLVAFGPDEAQRFCTEVDARSRVHSAALGIDADIISAGAREYVRRFAVHPVSSHTELHRQLQDAGFGELQSDLTQSSAEGGRVSGPSTTEQGTYARIVATRT